MLTPEQSAVALLNDSWEAVAHIDPTTRFSPLAPARAVMNDLFSLAVSMGGLMLLVFADLREEREANILPDFDYDGDWRKKRYLMTSGEWLLAAVAYVRHLSFSVASPLWDARLTHARRLWRFIFAIWSGCTCSRQRRERRERRARRRRRARAT